MLNFFKRYLNPKTVAPSTTAEAGKTDAELLVLYRQFARKALFHKNVKVHMSKYDADLLAAIDADIRGEERAHG